MTIKVNVAGRSNADKLIAAGNVTNLDDGGVLSQETPDWSDYAQWFLGIDTEADPETRDAYKYPIAGGEAGLREALTTIQQQAEQDGATDVLDDVSVLIEQMDRVSSETSRNVADTTTDQEVLTGEVERRHFVVDEIRVSRASGTPKIIGHAAVFNSDSEFMGFIERVAPGAFRQSITKDDVRALFNHDSNHVLGRNRAGTLRMTEDDIGLKIEIDPPDTQFARDLMVSMERGDINQMSFGFITRKDSWDYSGDVVVRTLQEVDLFDVSPVTFPAYPATDVAVRSMEKWKAEQKPEFNSVELKRKKLDLLTI